MDNWIETTRNEAPVPMYVMVRLPANVTSPHADATVAAGCVNWLLRALGTK